VTTTQQEEVHVIRGLIDISTYQAMPKTIPIKSQNLSLWKYPSSNEGTKSWACIDLFQQTIK